MATLTFKDLLASPPPLKKTVKTLPDGREYELHQLPLAAIDRIARQSRTAQENGKDLDWSQFGEVAAQAMLGRTPKAAEVQQLVETLGTDTVLSIYKDALQFSQLGSEAVDEAKKD